MKRIALLLVFMTACSKQFEPRERTSAPSSSTATPAFTTYENALGAKVDIPAGEVVDRTFENRSLKLRSGGEVHLFAASTCGMSLEVWCEGFQGELVAGVCIAKRTRLAVSGGVLHSVSMEGDVPGSVLASWRPPTASTLEIPCDPGFIPPRDH